MNTTTKAPMMNNSSHVQRSLQVNFTSNYSMFQTIKGNRPLNPMHIKRLAESIRRYGMLCNPILVNEKHEVIDGQHRLSAAIEANSPIYYIVIKGYSLTEVHALNLNQKNWKAEDYLNGYVDMGLKDYILVKEFWGKHNYYTLADCIALCSNVTRSSNFCSSYRMDSRTKTVVEATQVFNEGTWKVKDLEIAEKYAQNIKLIEPYFEDYNQSGFVSTMITLFKNPEFDFNEFMSKVRLQPTALRVCARRDQYKALIEDIYNYRRRDKVNLRFSPSAEIV